jgi:hypothetical protein
VWPSNERDRNPSLTHWSGARQTREEGGQREGLRGKNHSVELFACIELALRENNVIPGAHEHETVVDPFSNCV